jgi:hypothetical protein
MVRPAHAARRPGADEAAVDALDEHQLEALDEPEEAVETLRLRLRAFVALGFNLAQAGMLALSDVEVAEALLLVRRGCPARTAARILL